MSNTIKLPNGKSLGARVAVINNNVNPEFKPSKPKLPSVGKLPDHGKFPKLNTSLENGTFLFQSNVSFGNSTNLLPSTNLTNSTIYDGSPYPIFCGPNTEYECRNIALASCKACAMGQAYLMAVLVLVMLSAILFGNSLVLMVTVQRKRNQKLENMDLIRTSLAIADLLTGIQIFVTFLCNFFWSFSSTSKENHERYFQYHDSTGAAVGGVMYIFSFISSLYNMLYLAGQRLYAFFRPIEYKMQRKRNIVLALVCFWLFALVSSTVLVWFPTYFVAAYVPSTFLFFFEAQATTASTAAIAVLLLFYFMPFLLTIIFLSASAFKAYFHLQKISQPITPYSQTKTSQTASKTNEIQYFITVAYMEIGFAITIVPLVVVVLVKNMDPTIPYTHIAPSYAVCSYIAIANGLVNVLVYSWRDPKFRSSVRNICLSSWEPCGRRDHVPTRPAEDSNKQSTEKLVGVASPVSTSVVFSQTSNEPLINNTEKS